MTGMAIDTTYGWRVPEVRITRGHRLQAARRDAGISGDRMAELLGCSRRTITRYESDDSAPPAVVIAYAVATEANLGWLQTGVATLPPNVAPIDGRPVTHRYRTPTQLFPSLVEAAA
jgi:transcriptional regulator with XRE-family HTH domain